MIDYKQVAAARLVKLRHLEQKHQRLLDDMRAEVEAGLRKALHAACVVDSTRMDEVVTHVADHVIQHCKS